MNEQMEVFLQENTLTFIDSLFKTLSNKEYLDGPPKVSPKKADFDDNEGKPDSTTSTPANVQELASDLKEAEHKSHRSPEVRKQMQMTIVEFPKLWPLLLFQDERSRRRSSKDRRGSPPPRRRRSPIHRGRHRSRSPAYRRGGRRISPFGRRSRSRSFSPRRNSRSPLAPRRYGSRGSTPTRDEDSSAYTPSTVATKRPRCRDYDEKGFCLKGDQCKFDHGNDAVVLEDTAPSNTSVPPPPYLPGGYAEPYVPASTTPVLPPLHLPPPGYVPNASSGQPRKRSYEESNSSYPPAKRFDYNRLGRGRGGRGGGVGGGRHASSKVLVKNIPSGLNTIAHINNHFARFGTLVNVQVGSSLSFPTHRFDQFVT